MQLNLEKHTELVLQNVGTILKKYHEIKLISGENYNVFNILGLGTDELSHSKILANLLNTKGSHGQGDLYLKLFIQELLNLSFDEQFEEDSPHIQVLKRFNTKTSRVSIEKSIGYVNRTIGKGGRIDIIVTDDKDFIIIENKIYAVDQPLQLLRYKNFKPTKDTPILYLTLNGTIASEHSKTLGDITLVEKVDYLPISYKSHITKWLDECIKHSVDQPLIRETLKQYNYLIKNLTYQSTNNKMANELAALLANNYVEFKEILKVQNNVHQLLIENAKKTIDTICTSKGFNYDFKMNPAANYSGFNILSDKLSSLNLKISFEFESNTFYLGYSSINVDKTDKIFNQKVFEKCESEYTNVKQSKWWPAYFVFEECINWDQFYLSIHKEEFRLLIEEKITELMGLVSDL